MIKISSAIFKTFFLSLCIVANTHFAFAQTASVLPPGYTQYLDNNGNPLSAGKVYNYIPSTTTPKTTWQDAAETIPNTNPVILDAGGRAKILGDGSYRQIVKDRNNVTIWDAVTSSTGSGSSSPTATGDGDLVGTIKPWAGMTAPNQYAFTYGQEVSRTTYSALFTAITSSQAVFCNSGSAVLTGLSDTTNFWIGMAVEVSCVPTGATTIISKTSSTVTLAVNSNITTNTTAVFFPWGRGNGSTTFNLPDFRGLIPVANNNMGGVASSNLTSTYFGTADPNSIGGQGGIQFKTLVSVNIPGHNHSVFLNDPGHTHSITNLTVGGSYGGSGSGTPWFLGSSTNTNSSTTGTTIRDTSGGFGTANQTNYTGGGIAVSATLGNIGSGYTNGSQTITIAGGTCTTQPQFTVTIAGNVFTGTPALLTAGSCTVAPTNPAATTGGGGTGGTLNVVYSAQPFGIIPPTKTTNFIIKITPDTNSATASGVTSLGGMTGSIACGTYLTCTGNVISVSLPPTQFTCDQASSFGFIGDGVTNNDGAWSAWKASLPVTGGCLEFSDGIFNFNTESNYTYTGSACATGPANNKKSYGIITIRGIGRDLTTLAYSGTNGLYFNMCSFQNTVQLDDFTLQTSGTNVGNCITLTNSFAYFGEYVAKSRINVTCRGSDGYGGTTYWSKGIYSFNVSSIDYPNFVYSGSSTAGPLAAANGTGIHIVSSTTPGGIGTCGGGVGCGTLYNISGAKIDYAGQGIILDTQAQALYIDKGTSILNGFNGVVVPAGGAQIRQLNIIGAQISVNGDSITMGTAVSSVIIESSYIGVADTKNGIVFATNTGSPSSGGNKIIGNVFFPLSGSPSDCIYVATSTSPLEISGNHFFGCNTGIELTATSQNVLVGPNQYTSVVNTVLDSGTNNTVSAINPYAAQGDIFYGNGAANGVMSRLAKDTNATRYISNTGTNNNPAWAQINLSNGVTNRLAYANLAQGSALSVLGVAGNATADNASITAGSDNQVLRRSGTSIGFGTVANAGLTNSATTVAGQTCTLGSTCGLSSLTNSLGADVNLNNTANYFDGPSVAQGTTGTWFATGTVTLQDTGGAAAIDCKLWDGTTVIASAFATDTAAGNAISISLSGYLASPAANIKISCKDQTATTGKIKFNLSGNSKDSTLSVIRIN